VTDLSRSSCDQIFISGLDIADETELQNVRDLLERANIELSNADEVLGHLTAERVNEDGIDLVKIDGCSMQMM
jgi:uncharacterized protein YabE (DUF348 family)